MKCILKNLVLLFGVLAVFSFAACQLSLNNQEPVTYSVTYNTELGTAPKTITVTENTILSETQLPSLSAEGYTFLGWYDGTTKAVPDVYKVIKDVTLTAKWEALKYIITFNPNNGSVAESQTIQRGGKITKPANPTKPSTEEESYTFAGWYVSTDEGVTLAEEPFDFDTPVTKNITLYAKWTTNAIVYTVMFNTDGGTSVLTQTVISGRKVEKPANPTKLSNETETFSFENWYVSSDNGVTLAEEPFDFDTPIIANTTLYAKWIATPIMYTVSYVSARGNVPDSITVNATTVLSESALPLLSDDGFYFYGWYDEETKVVAGSYSVTKNVTLHAKWDFEDPLTMEFINEGTITITNLWTTLKYSRNDSILRDATETITVDPGDKVCFYSSASENTTGKCMTINCTSDCYIYGNIMSLVSLNSETGKWNTNATTLLSIYTFTGLFKGNGFIKNHNKKSLYLPATKLNSNCYAGMFSGCTSLTNAPELPATELKYCCYYEMFRDCTSLTNAPELPATKMALYCCYSMFEGCSNLQTAPALPSTLLADYCYQSMFKDCISLENAPDLPATILSQACYWSMFEGCVKLKDAPVISATTLNEKCCQAMFKGCTSLENAPNLPVITLAYGCYCAMFDGCTSLKKAPDLPATTLAAYCYKLMFNECTNLANAPKLPAKTLADSCYGAMFYKCISLENTPELSATILADSCYDCMFFECTGLKTASDLPATALKKSCYRMMFYNCTSLKSAPDLPATNLAVSCYEGMFWNCSGLVDSPDLPATILVESCYKLMFYNCYSLKYIKCLAEDISATNCTNDWLRSVSSTGIFVKSGTMENWTIGTEGIPSKWTVQNAE